ALPRGRDLLLRHGRRGDPGAQRGPDHGGERPGGRGHPAAPAGAPRRGAGAPPGPARLANPGAGAGRGGDRMTGRRALDRLPSRAIVAGRDRAPARAMLRAVGLTDEDFEKPIIGIANTWAETTPCNYHLRDLAEHVKQGVREAGG